MTNRVSLRRALPLSLAFLAAVALGGCDTSESTQEAPHGHEHDGGHSHSHDEEGPHHGVVIELDHDEYHAELVHDDKHHKVTIYILDEKLKDAVASDVTIKAMVEAKPRQFELKANPLDGEPEGKSSRFELTDETLVEAIDDKKAKARLVVEVDGREPFNVPIPVHDHDHDDDHPHDHDDDPGHDHDKDHDHDKGQKD